MTIRAQQILQPCERGFNVSALNRVGNLRTPDHDDRQPKLSRRFDLGIGRCPARVLADHDVDAVVLQQRQLISQRERAALENDPRLWRQPILIRRIDSAHQIAVLRSGAEGRHLLASDGEKNATRLLAQRASRSSHIRHSAPVVAGLRRPGSPLQPEQRNVCQPCGLDGIARHLRGERMRGVDQRANALVNKPARQSISTAEATDAAGNGGQQWLLRASGQRIQRVEAVIADDALRQRECLRRAAENENAHDTP